MSESGRSMVEMLGVLAIIGILSIGGIVGYSYGMDKHKANQTINDIMLMGVHTMKINVQAKQNIVPARVTIVRWLSQVAKPVRASKRTLQNLMWPVKHITYRIILCLGGTRMRRVRHWDAMD